jgi:hypothetical protein
VQFVAVGPRPPVVGQAPPRGTGVRAGRTHSGSSGSGRRAAGRQSAGRQSAGRQSVASFRAALAGVAGVPRLAPRCGPSAAGRREQPARRRRPAGPAHRRGAAAVAAAARARARRHRSGGRADLPVTGRPGQLPVLRPGHPRSGFRCVAVLVFVRDERLALDLQRCQRPRGRLGAGHCVPARPAG